MAETPSSPPDAASSPAAALEYYKRQYEQLESELAEFQASSQELEAELEKDVEAAEKRERTLQEKVESLTYEVDEWKVCKVAYVLGLRPNSRAVKVQAVEDGSEYSAEQPAERDYGIA